MGKIFDITNKNSVVKRVNYKKWGLIPRITKIKLRGKKIHVFNKWYLGGVVGNVLCKSPPCGSSQGEIFITNTVPTDYTVGHVCCGGATLKQGG